MRVLNNFSVAVNEIGEKILSAVHDSNERIVVAIAGTSASGKSYFAEKLRDYLKSRGIESFSVNADNFYKKETPAYVEFYESFDHKDTIDLSELRDVVKSSKSLNMSSITLPVYSFEKATRIGNSVHDLKGIKVIIVEGIYVLNVLHDVAHFSIYVKSSSPIIEMMRRFIRDSEGERLRLSPDYILKLLVGAYLMFDLFGKQQEETANYVIINDYDILTSEERDSWSVAEVLDNKEFSNMLKTRGTWYYYEDENGIELIIHEQINRSVAVFLKSNSGVLYYKFKSGREFMLLHLLAKIIGLNLYKIKEL